LVSGAYSLLAVTVGLIVYGSLYPWKFASKALPANPLIFLLHAWPATFDRFLLADCLINVFLYAPLGMLAFFALSQHCRKANAIAATLTLGFMLSACIELLQLFVKGRVTSALDLTCNTAGTAAGMVTGMFLQALLRRLVRMVGRSPFRRISGPVLLVFGWLAYQGFPFYPAISRTQLRFKLARLASPGPLSLLDVVLICAEWLAIASVFESIVGPRRARNIVPLIWLLVPARLLIEERTFSWAELAGTIFGCMLWQLLPLDRGGRIRLAAGVLIAALVWNGMAPFHFSSSAAKFSWIPFSGFLESEALPGMIVFLRKSFWYGSAVWLLRQAGMKLAYAVAAFAMLLAAIEAVQVYLPGRTAEVSDPLLAILLGVCLWLADRRPHITRGTLITKISPARLTD
jgi:VanZ family protein